MGQGKQRLLLSKISLYLPTFMIPVCIMLVILKQGEFYPFGDKTLFTMDMKDQYLEFFAYLRYMTKTDNSIFFCWSRSMGGNFLGLFAYYLASPLSFLVCFFPLERMDAAIVLLTTVKIGLCGVSFAAYGDYLWKRSAKGKAAPAMAIWIFASCYALISYNIVYSMCLMWLDGVILLPAVLLGVEKLLDGRGGLHYIICFAIMIFCNYYTAYMGGIFTAIYFLYRLICRKRNEVEPKIFTQVLRFGIDTVLAVGISMPLLLPIINDLRQGKLAGANSYQLSFEPNFLFSDFLGKFRNGVYDSITDSGLPSVYCGVIILVFAAVFFVCTGVSLREKIGIIAILAIMISSFYYKGLNLIWHGFQFPIWFPYRYAFVFSFVMVYMSFRAMCELSCRERDELRKENYGILSVLLILSLIDLKTNGQILLEGVEKQFGYAGGEEYQTFLDKTKPLVDKIQEHDQGLYRINVSSEYSKNDAMLLGYHGMTHYSSTYNTEINRLTQKLGVAQTHIWNSGYGTGPLLDSLFAVAYKLSDRYEPSCYEKIADGGNGMSAYRNNLVLPMVYASYASVMDPELLSSGNPYRNQNRFLNAIAGKEENYFEDLAYEYNELTNGWSYTLTVENTDPLYLYMEPRSGGWANVYVNDVWYGNYFSSETSCSLYVGSYEDGQQVTIRVEPSGEGVTADSAVIARLDMGLLQTTLEELQSGGMEIESHRGGKIQGHISVQEGQTVMTSIPYDEGWTVKVDGKKVDIKRFAGTFLAVDVPAGNHKIVFNYVSPGFYVGLGIFLLSLIIIIIGSDKPGQTRTNPRRTHFLPCGMLSDIMQKRKIVSFEK